jgi:SAM-dependent methyltransferase
MNHNNYFNYLKTRSNYGFLYRKYFLYPILDFFLKKLYLDVGCGLGDFLKKSKKCKDGLEINDYLIEYCPKNNLKVDKIENEKFLTEDNSFSSVILNNFLEHISEAKSLIKEIERVLVPKSIFIVGVPGKKGYQSYYDHKIFYDNKNIYALIESYNFKRIKVLRMPIPLIFLGNYLNIFCNYYIFEKI